MFDWTRFFKSQGIAYVTRGPNVGRGGCAIRCPFCGAADPSEHMVVSLRVAGWRCWRNPRAHSGKSRSWLIQALLNCSPEEARRLAGEEGEAPPEDADLTERLGQLLGLRPTVERAAGPLQFLPEFKPLKREYGSAAPFWNYLEERGYSTADAVWLAEQYKLQYTIRGPFRYRLILPIYGSGGELATWTARSIRPQEEVRYKTLLSSPREGYSGPLALRPPGQLLLGLPLLTRCANPEILVLCEGPFDALRITVLGRGRGVYGTCLFGLNITDSQVLLLERLLGRFRKLVLLLDPDAELLNLRIREQLTFPVMFGRLPAGVEDPGALSAAAGQELMQTWLGVGTKRERSYG